MTLKLHHECTCVEICLENVECSPKSGYLVAESSMNTKNRPSNAKPKVDEIACVQDLIAYTFGIRRKDGSSLA